MVLIVIDQLQEKIRINAKDYKIKDYKTLFTLYDTNKIQPVKKALSQKNPVIIGMRTPKSFSYAKDIWYLFRMITIRENLEVMLWL